MAIMSPRVENKVIHHERRKAKWRTCGKKKGCWYGYECFRLPTHIAVPGCPATRVLRNLKERTKATLMCLVSLSWKRPTVPSYSSSASTPKPSKQLSASSDSHRNQAVQDCISYINSSTASSSSSSSTVTARSPPPTSSVAQTPPSTIATVTIPPPPPPPTSSVAQTPPSTIATVTIPPPPPPPHFSPISTIQNKSTSAIPSTCP